MFKAPEEFRVTTGPMGSDSSYENNGLFIIPAKRYKIKVVISQDPLWEHVSISLSNNRLPTWTEMCAVKDIFWDPSDCVMQLHPPESEHVSDHPHCLHLWRPVTTEIPQPPPIMVGMGRKYKGD